ncbi:trans-aconitate methyltransferase [Ornithinimicrobium pekingense]|uniref:Class I SAM-dependent methyltransferase n=1 Tax=Ornithinimicrobium pekingense TaxID=384677 RepID=A0ABQ2F6J4_9MICO|nr:trans-aconitate methyltransferase [Ornithinimicrobium pekingense]GGK56208.1 hypothetical protein GCM10011509_00730 [Ornithinimicrobium pekingense]
MTTQEPTGRHGQGPPSRASADWLTLRREADTEARDAGATVLLERLVDHLRAGGTAPVRVVDVGAGTGANHAYLSPRLPLAQDWVVVDHDPDLLGHAGHGDAVRVRAGVRDLAAVLEDLLDADGADDRPTLLTCTALLDVLTTEELGQLADAVARTGGPALFALSVTGEVRWTPCDPADGAVAGLFDAHQRRGGRPGPLAPSVLTEQLVAHGLAVERARTPWVLDARRPQLLERFLVERADAAREQAGQEESRRLVDRWLTDRLRQVRSAGLSVRVGHVDLLVLPHRAEGVAGRPGEGGG